VRHPSRGFVAAVFLLTLATLAVYARTFGYGYIVIDDSQYVYQNGIVKQGFTAAGLAWAFTTFSSANWHPLTWISLMLDCQLFRLYPGEEHAVNVFLHLGAALLLFAALLKMTGHIWRCALVAGVFALHPMHVESVAWVSERKDVLSAFFEMLTLILYAVYVERPDRKRYAVVALAFAAALLSKPMAVTFPLALLLLDYWPLKRMEWPVEPAVLGRLAREKLPLLALSAPACFMTFRAQRDYGAVVPLTRFPLPMRLGHVAVAYVQYLEKTFWPASLAALYPLRPPTTLEVVGSLSILVLLTAAAVRFARRKPYLLVGWLWFLGTLVPVIGLVQVGVQSIADRYMYVPMIGLSIAIIWAAADAVQGRPVWRRAALAIAVASLMASAFVAFRQVGYWRSSKSLFLHTLAITKDNYKIEHDLGLALAQDGDTAGAIRLYRRALAIPPDWPEALVNLGAVLVASGQFKDAVPPLRNALRLDPRSAQTHAVLGAALAALGSFGESRQHLEIALRGQPYDVKSQSNLCYALQRSGRLEEAIAHCNIALRLDPGYEDAHLNLGNTLAAQGRKAEAAAEFSRLLAANPHYAAARAALRQLQ
jgi:protein O-mannosyl-transferase